MNESWAKVAAIALVRTQKSKAMVPNRTASWVFISWCLVYSFAKKTVKVFFGCARRRTEASAVPLVAAPENQEDVKATSAGCGKFSRKMRERHADNRQRPARWKHGQSAVFR